MPKALVIVESPAKARTIAGMLGPDFVVESSVGHIRDLPRGADEIPAAYKGEEWSRLGVDVDNGFKPLYVVSPEKKSVVANLKRQLKQADELYLATDEDREGESIAWHLFEVLAPQIPVKRMVFHEITPAALAAGRRGARASSTGAWSTPRRPAGSSTACTATRSRRCCGRRSCPGCRPAGSRAWPPAWWWSGSGPGCVPRRPPGGGSRGRSPPRASPTRTTPRPRAASPPRWSRRRHAHRDRARLQRRRRGRASRRGAGPRRGRRAGPGRPAGGRDFTVRSVTERPFRRSPGRPVHDLDPPAGGRPQAPLQRRAGHAGGPAPVRAGLDHLHADRLDHAVGRGARGGPVPGHLPVRRRTTSPTRPGATSAR